MTTDVQSPFVLAALADAAQTALNPAQIDGGYYPKKEMAQLGALGAFNRHLSANGHDFAAAILATAAIGRVCGTTAFLAWCQQVCGLYIDLSDNAALKTRILPAHATAKTLGGTALSNPMKAFAGIETLLLTAQKTAEGYVVSGTLPWISHIASGQYCGAIAKLQGSNDSVFFLLEFDQKRADYWTLAPCPEFIGMEGSSTWRIVLDSYPLADADIIANKSSQFVPNVRAAFVLLQIGMGAGIIQGAIDDIKATMASHAHVNAFLEDNHRTLQAELDCLLAHTLELATRLQQAPKNSDKGLFIDVIGTRIAAAKLCLKATQAAMLHAGARGYIKGVAVERRLREAQFVAIVTPAIKHLRKLAHDLLTPNLPDGGSGQGGGAADFVI